MCGSLMSAKILIWKNGSITLDNYKIVLCVNEGTKPASKQKRKMPESLAA